MKETYRDKYYRKPIFGAPVVDVATIIVAIFTGEFFMNSHGSASGLVRYYLLRAGVAAAWFGAAMTVGRAVPAVGAALLVAYPAWDALANGLDARAHGGFRANTAQAVNVAVSATTALAMAVALTQGLNAALGVFGVWAILAGVLQLVAGLRRWRAVGSQWSMVLSGGQSAIVGFVFLRGAFAPAVPGMEAFAPYAAFGALYFLVAAIALTIARRRAVVPVA
jgi:hypothetical protein